MPPLDLILGPPGTGKTTTLVAEVRQQASVRPDDVALVSFTNAAADVARTKVARDLALHKNDLPHFRTLHSLAFRGLGLSRDDVFDQRDLAEFAETSGFALSRTASPGEDEPAQATPGDAYLRAIETAAAIERPLADVWARLDASDAWHGTSAEECVEFAAQYRAFKRKIGRLDFADLLVQYAERGTVLDVSLAVIDEAQDLTRAQWRVARRAFAAAERLIVAGDDDQAIYAFAGADVKGFLTLGREARTVTKLRQSHRIPLRVHTVAQRIAAQIAHRYAKSYDPRGVLGSYVEEATLAAVEFDLPGSTMVLARHNYLLDAVEREARERGLVYTRAGRPSVPAKDVATLKAWVARPTTCDGKTLVAFCAALGRPVPSVRAHDAVTLTDHAINPAQDWRQAFQGWSPSRRDYYAAVLAEGHRLSDAPRLHLSTIHAAKGGEADTVVLLTDLSAKARRTLDLTPDHEHRVFYVGATRAIERLVVVGPQQAAGYPLDF